MDDDFGADADFLAALAGSDGQASKPAQTRGGNQQQQPVPQRIQQPTPQKIQQPAPQRLDKAPPSNASAAAAAAAGTAGPKVVQPTPQVLPTRSSGSSILVSPRQKGNPVIACLKSMPWEYSDIPADYVLGLTTCALFLSLKYHRLHPEYIYTRIRNLQGRYNLRILLTMVDIPNHEDSLRELSKTSMVSNVTMILCWSAAEAARYLELYKSYEHAGFSAIRGQQATGYAEKLVEFVTVPRRINKADAVALVSTFGSLRNAVNADREQVAVVGGWGERKVKAWCDVVDEPFRVKKAGKRSAGAGASTTAAEGGDAAADGATQRRARLDQAVPLGRVPLREIAGASRDGAERDGTPASGRESDGMRQQPQQRQPQEAQQAALEDEEEAMMAAALEESARMAREPGLSETGRREEALSDGIAAALAKLRNNS